MDVRCNVMDNLLQQAKELEHDKKWAEAAKAYVSLLQADDADPIIEKVAWCYSRDGKYKEAISYLMELYKHKPTYAKACYMIGYQYYCLKQWNNAIVWYEKALEIYPDYFIVKYRLAYSYIQVAGNFMRFTKAECWKALGHLNDCHNIWANFSESKRLNNKSIYFDINFLHGKILMNLPNYYMKAVGLFKEALTINPDNEDVQYELSKTHYINGNYCEAKNNLPRGNKYYVLELSALIDTKLGNYDDAITTLEKLISFRRKDYLFTNLAYAYMLKGETDQAFKYAKMAVSIGKNNHKNYYLLAKICYSYGLLDKSLLNLQKAVDIKREKYKTSFIECEELMEKIKHEKPQNYVDNQALIKKLDEMLKDNNVKSGVITKFNDDRGFGFIKYNSQSLFFHVSNCKHMHPKIGDKVKFNVSHTEKGTAAVNISLISCG